MIRDKIPVDYKNIYESYVNELFSYGTALGIEKGLLQDIIHDVFLHLFEHQNLISEHENLKYYLFRCLKNRLIDIKRKEVTFESIDEADDQAFSIKVTGLELIEEEEERINVSSQIEQMLQSLTGRQREAVYLRFMQELEYDEIAVLLDITPKGARKLIYRAIDHMRELYGPAQVLLILLLARHASAYSC